jgi:hypothetical protein
MRLVGTKVAYRASLSLMSSCESSEMRLGPSTIKRNFSALINKIIVIPDIHDIKRPTSTTYYLTTKIVVVASLH